MYRKRPRLRPHARMNRISVVSTNGASEDACGTSEKI